MRIAQLTAMTAARLMTLGADATPRTAALMLSKPGIGLIVVTHGNGEAAGVLTKSDLIRHMADPDLAETTAAGLMSRPFISCGPDDDVHCVWQAMAEQGLQNLPVLDGSSRPLGILDIRDAMKALFEQEELQAQLMANYIAGVGYQ
jgi:CBS domain-containing protein